MGEKKIAILTDSASEISKKAVEQYDIKVIPLRICFSDKTYRDRIEINSGHFFEKLKEEIPKTSLPSVRDILKILDEIKGQGYTDVLYIGLSSGLSGTFHFVSIVGREYEGLNFYSFDTKMLSGGEGSLVLEAAKMLEKTNDITSVIEKLRLIRERMSALFVVENLTYLNKGGRIGKVAGTVGSLLHLNPVIEVNEEGVYETAGKTIGFTRAIDFLIKEIQNRFAGKKIIVSLVVGKDREKAIVTLRKIKKFSEVVESSIGFVTPVLGAHTGPGLLGVIVYTAE